MLLAITALGYASVWVEGTLLPKLEEYNKALGLPDNMRLVVVLPIGAAAKPTEQADKKPLASMLHWERYGRKER
jgi:nitroreductase